MYVPKPGTNKERMVINYRKLNKAVKRRAQVLPRMDEQIDRLQQANSFTKFETAFTGYEYEKGMNPKRHSRHPMGCTSDS